MLLTTCSQLITASTVPQTVTPLSMTGINVGTQLLVDVSNSEIVTVTATTSGTFTAIFTKQHLSNWTIGLGLPLFAATSVKLGAIQDPTDITPCVSVTRTERRIERFGTGYKVNSHPTLLIETLADMADATSAEIFITQAADVLVAIFMARATIPGAPQTYMIYGGQFQKNIPPDTAKYKAYPSGRIYRCHQMEVQAVDQFSVQFN